MKTQLVFISFLLIISLAEGSVDYSLVRPAVIDGKDILPCPEDYSPCVCGDYPPFGLYVICELVNVDDIVSVFNRTSSADLFWLQLRPRPDLLTRTVTLPPTLLSGKRSRAIDLYCPSVVDGSLYKLNIDRNALNASQDLMEYFYVLGCDLIDQQDFNFLTGFNKLTNLYLYGSVNVQGIENLPALKTLGTLSINQCSGLSLITNFPAQSFQALEQVYLTDNELDDQVAGRILTSIVSSASVGTVKVLSLAYNLLTEIPSQVLSFSQLVDLSLSGNHFSTISFNSLALKSPRVDRLALANSSILSIQPGALRDNIVIADLTRNNLTRFESAVFQPMLQGMATLNGSLSVDSNPFACDCSIAWLIRDNRKLLTVVQGGECSNSTRFDELDPAGFKDCPLRTSLHRPKRLEELESYQ